MTSANSLCHSYSTGRLGAIFMPNEVAMGNRYASTRFMKEKDVCIRWMCQAWCLNERLFRDVARFIKDKDLREMMGCKAHLCAKNNHRAESMTDSVLQVMTCSLKFLRNTSHTFAFRTI